jgi:putative membrane protein
MLLQWDAQPSRSIPDAMRGLPPLVASLQATAASAPTAPVSRERLDAVVVGVLVLLGIVYLVGFWRLWGRSQGARWSLLGRAAACGAGMALLLLALLPPLDALTTLLFTAHIAQYLLLADVVSPLLIVGQAGGVLLAALPTAGVARLGAWWARSHGARRLWAIVTLPPLVATLDVALLVAWYQPRPFTAALASGSLHLIEQLSILLAALLFWWTIRHPDARPALGHGRVLISFFAASLGSAAFGLTLYLARRPWYPAYGDAAARWHLTLLGDQQAGAIVLGVAPELLDLLAMLALLWGWIRAQERRATARARAERRARRRADLDASEPRH